MKTQDWQSKGKFIEIGGHRVFVIDKGEHENVLLVLHGYPTSSYDFHKVLPELSKSFRVIIHDHLGFGFSDKPLNYSYSIMEQADIALQLWTHLGIESAHLFAHDYGTSVATELMARRNIGIEPVKLRSLTLCNGSVHIEMAKLRFIQKLLRSKLFGPTVAKLSSFGIFKKNMSKLWFDKNKIDQDEFAAMWSLLNLNGGKTVLPKITRYLIERELFWDRWVGALQKTDLKTNILWGRNDPITDEKVALVHHNEMKNSTLSLLDDTGHYPMVENPEGWLEALLKLLKTTD